MLTHTHRMLKLIFAILPAGHKTSLSPTITCLNPSFISIQSYPHTAGFQGLLLPSISANPLVAAQEGQCPPSYGKGELYFVWAPQSQELHLWCLKKASGSWGRRSCLCLRQLRHCQRQAQNEWNDKKSQDFIENEEHGQQQLDLRLQQRTPPAPATSEAVERNNLGRASDIPPGPSPWGPTSGTNPASLSSGVRLVRF